MIKAITKYFSEFKMLKHCSKDFWLTNAIQFFDGMAYFAMITVLALYLTNNCGFNDIDAGTWVGIFTLYITAFAFAVGSICDTIGIKKSLYIGLSLLAVSRLGMGLSPILVPADSNVVLHLFDSLFGSVGMTTPEFLNSSDLGWSVKISIIVMALGSTFMAPVIMTSMRRFTNKETRATGFNIYYLLMNVGAIIASAVVLDGLRRIYGNVDGNIAILFFGFGMSILAFIAAFLIDENNFAEESERFEEPETPRRPLAVFIEVWKEPAFQKLLLFLGLVIGVRLVFTHQFLVMPKYYTRLLYNDIELGLMNSINPAIIIVGLIVLIPILNRYSTFKLIVVGMTISALSLVVLALPIQWILAIPGINTLSQAYFFIIMVQIIVFAVGELFFNPRFMEYIASVAPPDKVSSYMVLSALPNFIAKPVNGFVSGVLIYRYCYDGIRAKVETGNVSYLESPEFMWMIYLLLAISSPIAVLLLKNKITNKPDDVVESEETTNKEGGRA